MLTLYRCLLQLEKVYDTNGDRVSSKHFSVKFLGLPVTVTFRIPPGPFFSMFIFVKFFPCIIHTEWSTRIVCFKCDPLHIRHQCDGKFGRTMCSDISVCLWCHYFLQILDQTCHWTLPPDHHKPSAILGSKEWIFFLCGQDPVHTVDVLAGFYLFPISNCVVTNTHRWILNILAWGF